MSPFSKYLLLHIICREALRRFEDVRHDLLKSQLCSLQPVQLLKLFNYSDFIRTFKGTNSERACLHFSALDVLVEFERLIVMHVSHSALIVSLLFSAKIALINEAEKKQSRVICWTGDRHGDDRTSEVLTLSAASMAS